MSTNDPVTLPLVSPSCTLEPPELHDQFERYRQLSRHMIRLQHEPGELVAQFSNDLPAGLVEQTLELERDCCSFLSIAYDRLNRRLAITTDAADHDATLAALFSALSQPLGARFLESPQSDQSGLASINTREREPNQCCEPAALETCASPAQKTPAAQPPGPNRRPGATAARSRTRPCVHPIAERAHPR